MREIIKARVSGYQLNFIAELIINQTVFNVHLTGKSLFEILKNQCANFKTILQNRFILKRVFSLDAA